LTDTNSWRSLGWIPNGSFRAIWNIEGKGMSARKCTEVSNEAGNVTFTDLGAAAETEELPLKPCCRCGKPKPRDAFYLRTRSPDGLTYACKACIDEENAEKSRRLKEGDPATLAAIGTRHVQRLANRTRLPREEIEAREASGMFFCGMCERWKPRGQFYPDRTPRSPTGVRERCKACVDEARKANELRHEREADVAMGQRSLLEETDPAPDGGDVGGQRKLFDVDGDDADA
jgi:hypothetical protein